MNNPYVIKGKVVTENSVIQNGIVEITNDKISFVGEETSYRSKSQENQLVTNGWICPGFIDVHVHGIHKMDFMDEGNLAFEEIPKLFPRYGVTSFLATSRTAPIKEIKKFLEKSLSSMRNPVQLTASLLGIHLEGPWINPKYKGAQKEEHIIRVDQSELEQLIDFSEGMIKIVTLAPEFEEHMKAIHYLNERQIIVSAGHTDASMNDIEKAIQQGLKHITHTFNAMSSFHHRSTGTVNAALYYDDLICKVIADGLHVDNKMIELIYRLKTSDQIIFVSDCTGANNLPDGTYELGGKRIIKDGHEIKLQDGTLAGSAITLADTLKHVVEKCSILLVEVVKMISTTPARALQIGDEKGKIKKGYDADITIIDQEYHVNHTIVGGQMAYSAR